MKVRSILLGAVASVALIGVGIPASAAQFAVNFNLIDGGGAAVGTTAYKGFNAAAKFWSGVLTTSQPTTVNFRVAFAPLGPGILGQTGSTYTSKFAVNVENRILARQSTDFDAALQLAALHDGDAGPGTALEMVTPGYTGAFADGSPYGIDNSTSVYDVDGGFNNSVIGLTTANAKAIGYGSQGTGIDARITFSSQFKFDFTPENGIAAGRYDFLGVAIHEMGHALGFVSGVDDYDVLGTGGPFADEVCFSDGTLCKDYPANDDWFGTPLDLFRYSAADRLDWTTNTPSYFSADRGQTAFGGAHFSTGDYNGDGWQASHWKAPQLPSGAFSCAKPKVGIMNPYLCGGRLGIVTGLDLAALDAIGWNAKDSGLTYSKSTADILFAQHNVPEPATWALMLVGFGAMGTMLRRRRSALI